MRSAFTIIESVFAICIIAILSAICVPGLTRVRDGIEVRAAAAEISSVFSAARHLAITRGSLTYVEIDTSRRSVGVRIGADTLRRAELGRDHHVQVKTTRASVTFSPIGVGYGAANLSIIVTRNSAVDSIIVSRLGRVRQSD